ncbi:MAG: hypothetical protein INR73_05440 [Williamsia sp.]|nr:hypothetical protein [Williamsia sp.]
MNPENRHQTTAGEGNEDLDFDRTNVSTTDTQAIQDNEMGSEPEPVDQNKQEELAANEVRPLSEGEKQPKLQDPERIEEMNRRTSIGD